MEKSTVKILYKSKNLVAVYKPPLIPSQSDPSGDADAMTITSELLRENKEPEGLWLVHRLDRVVGGLLVFARNKKSAAELSSLVQDGGMVKEYFAVVEGAPSEGQMRDYIYKDAVKGKAFVTDRSRGGVKEAILICTPLETVETDRGERTLVRAKLITGRFHQIRAQFSSRGMPLVGDGKYGSRDSVARLPALFAGRLSFKTKSESLSLSEKPPIDEYPWSLFKIENFD